jgi:hypothetical protein
MNEDDLVAQIRAKLDTLNPGERRLAQLRLDRILRRKRALAAYPSPGHLAKLLAPDTVQTKMMTALDQIAIAADSGFQRQWIISTPPQEGKLVAHSELVPTPGGWVKHGDIRTGDFVFAPDGHPIEVTHIGAIADAWLTVHFSDHSSIKVHPRHEWTVYDRNSHCWRTVDTEFLAEANLEEGEPGRRGHRYRFQLPFREPLQAPDADLPVEPYALGVWLGDGNTRKGGVITHHPDDGYDLSPYAASSRWVHPGTGIVNTTYPDLTRALRAAGLLGNKHIPAAYLRASEAQRRALLAGLVDTDGHAALSGQVSFDNGNPLLIQQVAELARTLGYRAHVHRPTPPKLSSSGIQGKLEMWRVTFTPHDQHAARLDRKRRGKLGIRRRVAITGVTEGIREPGRCLTVDSEDGLYLVGDHFTPTHNTMRMGTAVPLWLLMRNPQRRIIIASYEQTLAARSTLAVRQAIETFGAGYKGDRNYLNQEDQLGLILDPDQAKQANWNLIDGPGRRNGGMVAVGVGGSLTGRSADVMIIDDAVKNALQADNPVQRQAVWDWYQSVASTRLSPGAIVVVIGTRWHEDDLIGRIIKDDQSGGGVPAFQQLVIPAIAKSKDPLGRKPGQYLVSTRKRTVREWKAIRRRVGERFWSAMYMGEPHPPAGGIFKLEWIEHHRRPVAPELSVVEVFVDPADNEGDGDEAGVITMGRGAADQHLYVLADDSGHMTSGRWFRVAFLAALRHDASAVRYEKSLSGLRRIGRKAWKDLLREAKKLHELDPFKHLETDRRPEMPDEAIIFEAAGQLARDDAEPAEIVKLQRDLTELWPLVPQVLDLPPTGIPVQSFPAKGTKTHRAKMAGPMHEWGHVHWVGDFVELKYQMVAWQESQDSPDRMDAYVHGITKLGQTGDSLMDPPSNGQQRDLPKRPNAPGSQVLQRQGVARSGLGVGGGRFGP